MHQFFFGTFLVAAIALISSVGTPVHAGDATPEAPSDVQALGGVLYWSDNSDNEDGFRIVIRLGPGGDDIDLELHVEVAADITSFVLPPEAAIQCPDRTEISFEVVAFNNAGDSEPGRSSIVVICPAPTAEATPEAPSDVLAFGGVLHWSDNSDTEVGFRITIRSGPNLRDFEFEGVYEVGPDTTTFVVPEEVPIGCPDYTAISFQVIAFNEAGESEPFYISIETLCSAPTPTPSPVPTQVTTEPTVLPGTGTHFERDSHSVWPGVLAAFGVLTLVAAGAALRLKRS